jgi:hypothetical protein
MPHQPAGALDETIDRSKVTDHDVPVRIQTLFDNLRRNDQPTLPVLRPAVFAE